MNKGLYLHIPFCYRKCPFCDYYSISNAPETWLDTFTDVIVYQLRQLPTKLDTLYVGGGTPLVLGQSRWERILQNLPEARERTIELNPEDVKKENFPLLAHFTRLSVGVQSFSDSVLKTLGRDKLDYEKLLDLLSHWDVSVDLMVGVPGQTRDEVLRDLISVVALGVPHISVYPLEVHEGTPFWGYYRGWDWDDADLLLMVEKFLTEHGYEHYEISNYARRGHQCLHNKIYWHDEEYYALGPSAAGYVNGVRYKWVSNLRLYVESAKLGEPTYEEYVALSWEEQLSEYAIMNLRLLSEGIRKEDVEKRFGERAWGIILSQAEGNAFLNIEPNKITVKNWLFFNRAAEAFV